MVSNETLLLRFISANVDWSPYLAQGSNRVYGRDFRIEEDRSYQDSSVEGNIALARKNNNWTFQGGLQMSNHNIKNKSIDTSNYWEKPHLGTLERIYFQNTSFEDKYKNVFDGSKAKVKIDSFFAPENWERMYFNIEHGKHLREFYVNGEAAVFYGTNLNEINAHFIGGSWDMPDTNKSYGSKLFQYRLDQGGLLNLRIDHPVVANLDISFEGGVVLSQDEQSGGLVLKLFKKFSGILIETGVSTQATFSGEHAQSQFVFARVTCAGFL